MSDEKIKVECRLVTKSAKRVDAKVISDLAIPDPEKTVGKQIIEDVMEKEQVDGDKSDDS